MPVYLDTHDSLGDASPDDVAAAHAKDLETQKAFGVRWLTYWFNDAEGKSFCLVESPDAETAIASHKAAHGLVPHRIIEVDGDSMASFFGEWKKNADDRALHPNGEADLGIRAIMFTDIVGSTQLASTMGDARAMEVVRSHDEIVRSAIDDHGGSEIKHTGDGIMASFSSVASSVKAAMVIQAGASAVDGLSIRVGLSAGEPLEAEGDLFGSAVNLAARLCDHAEPDQIVVASVVKDLTMGKRYEYVALADADLKGFAEPVRCYEVAWR